MKRNRSHQPYDQFVLHVSGPRRHFGLPSDEAVVKMWVSDSEHADYAQAAIEACFTELWGERPVVTSGHTPNAQRSGEVVFEVWHNGDMSVGIPGDQATVTMWVADEEYLEHARTMLKVAFSEFWDFRAHVMTSDELQEEERTEVYEPNANWTLELASAPNPDLWDRGGFWQGGMQGPTERVRVSSYEEASRAAQAYISEYDLGGGNWTGGRIFDASGREIARVAYNGTVWEPGTWEPGMQRLWPPDPSAKLQRAKRRR